MIHFIAANCFYVAMRLAGLVSAERIFQACNRALHRCAERTADPCERESCIDRFLDLNPYGNHGATRREPDDLDDDLDVGFPLEDLEQSEEIPRWKSRLDDNGIHTPVFDEDGFIIPRKAA